MKRLVTIGVYGWDLDGFLEALERAEVSMLLDVRQRRGVRGREYAWANAVRLQQALADARVAYHHHKELAPTTELRQLQYAEDARVGVGKRSRIALAQAYRERYIREVLDRVALDQIVEQLPLRGAAALLCVESAPQACHRSIIAQRMAAEHEIRVSHLQPDR